MELDRFDLLHAVVEGHARTRFDISTSNMLAPDPRDLWGPWEWKGDVGSSPLDGLPDLRALLARLHGGTPEEYMITHGTSEANFLTYAALLRPGDEVLVERPYYQPLVALPRALGARVRFLPRTHEQGYAVDMERVEELVTPATRLLVLSNLHNPSGVATGGEALRGLASLAAERRFFILIDEVFREATMEAPPPTARGMGGRVVVTSSVSKYQGLGALRVGWVAGPEEVLRKIRRVVDYTTVAPSTPSQWLALEALQRVDYFQQRTKRIISLNRATAQGWIEGHGGRVEWVRPAGNIAFPRTGIPMEPVARKLLRDHSTFIAPGEYFGAPRHFRLSLGCDPQTLREGLGRLNKAMVD